MRVLTGIVTGWLCMGAALPAAGQTGPVCEPEQPVQFQTHQLFDHDAVNLYASAFTAADILPIIDQSASPAQEYGFGVAIRAMLTEQLEAYPAAARDIQILGLLDRESRGNYGLLRMLTMPSAGYLPLYRDGLSAFDQSDRLRLIDAAIAILGGPDKSPMERRAIWQPKDADMPDPRIDDAIKALSDEWQALPPLWEVMLDQIAADPNLRSYYADRRADAGDDQRRGQMLQNAWACFGAPWQTPQQADAVFDAGPAAQRDMVLLSMLLGEIYNGGAGQLVDNYAGTMIPQMRQILLDGGLRQEGAALTTIMALFDTPYPRDTVMRRMQMSRWTADPDWDALTTQLPDTNINELIDQIGKAAGLWPLSP
ncbi:hypothetical protein [Yoonia sp. SS1-5]|uniref:DNA mimic protein DMP19 C-terminal domain-containing protein n=2 Tax=Yoonia rhodophyticola TaxID=3137370 RepID=A0ABZ3JCV2_9RHOB